MLCTGFALETISSTCLLLSWSTTGLHNFQELSPALLSDGATFHSMYGSDSAPCLSMHKLGSRASKTLCLRIQFRHICTLLSSWVRVHPQLGSVGKQSCCLGLLLGTASMNSVCQDPCTGCCKPIPLVTFRFPVAEPYTFFAIPMV